MSLFNRSSSKSGSQQPDAKHTDSQPDWWDAAFLVDEAEFRHQQHSVKRSSRDDQVTLGYILKEILNIDPADVGAMTIVSREAFASECKTETIEDPSDVLAYKPFDAILDCTPDGKCKIRCGQNTVLVISFRPSHQICLKLDERKDKSNQHTDNSIIMYLRALDPFSKGSEYMRVSVMIPNFIASDDFRNPNPNTPFTASFILVYDTVPPEKRLEGYDRVMQSLDNGINAGRSLTNEEQAVLEGLTGSKGLGYEVGYGRWLVSQKRFADALLSLTKAYDKLKTMVVKNDNPQLHELFVETCYNIGYCYNELEQFDRAAYYLGLVQEYSADVHHAMEYINALVNSNDPRAMSIVSQHIRHWSESKWKDTPEGELFSHFLYRRLAYLYIEYEMWDKARELLEQMKDSSEDRDFALGELEYLRRLGKV